MIQIEHYPDGRAEFIAPEGEEMMLVKLTRMLMKQGKAVRLYIDRFEEIENKPPSEDY